MQPDFSAAHCELGASLLELDDISGVIEHLRGAFDTAPADVESHYNLALAYWMAQSYDAARREIDAAFRLNTKDDQTRRLRDLMNDGSAP